MNQLKGTIIGIKVNGNLSLIDMDVKGETFKAILIETPETLEFLKTGNEINIMFKETEVVIGKKEYHAISLRNRLLCKIESIKMGPLLSKISMSHSAGNIGSIITSNAVESLELVEGEEVWAMIKTNEVTISE